MTYTSSWQMVNGVTAARGIRLNNPTCIRHGSDWQGMAAVQSDPAFVEFIDVRWCFRATSRILDAYKKRGINTVAKAISTWAPPSENNTAAYISVVCTNCGVTPYQIIDLAKIKLTLVDALIMHENGQQPYTDAQILEGFTYTGEPIVTQPQPKQPGWTPNLAPATATAGLAVGNIIIWAIQTYTHVVIPPEIVLSIDAICTAAGSYLHPSARS